MIKHRVDSIKELKKKPNIEKLAKENKEITKEITDVQMALVEVTTIALSK